MSVDVPGPLCGGEGCGILLDPGGSAVRRAAPVQECLKKRGEGKRGEMAGLAPQPASPSPAWALLCLPEAPGGEAATLALEGWPGMQTGAGLTGALSALLCPAGHTCPVSGFISENGICQVIRVFLL